MHCQVALHQYFSLHTDSDVIILTYALNEEDSFDELEEYWMKEIQQIAPDTKIFLLGNKADLERKVSAEKIEKFVEDIGATYCEVSCKNHEGVLMAWEKILKYIFSHRVSKPKRPNLRIRQHHEPRHGFFEGLKDCFSFLFN